MERELTDFEKHTKVMQELEAKLQSVPPNVVKSNPTLLDKAMSLASAGASALNNIVNGESPFATEEVAEARFDICKNKCDKLIDGVACKLCGCNMPLKTKLKSVECPIRKW